MKALVVLVSLGALSGPAHAAPPPLFAKLFKPGAHWTFAAEQIDSYYDTEQHTDTTKGEVECAIDDVQTIKHGWTAELTCSGMTNAGLANGTFVATSAGLWRADADFDGDVTKLAKAKMLIGATPKAGQRTRDDETILVKPHAGAWCFADMTAGGDEGGWMLCIDAKHGLVGGNGFFAGGATHDTYFGKSPRY